ncbi:MAG: NaeI family type II restriction endonuclease [Verrucomicrobiales bacterium]
MAADGKDPGLGAVVEFFLQRNGFAQQAAATLRQALDEVIDGMRTGRWSVDELEKTEKTYLGTKVEILFKFDFELPDGETLDARIEGVEVDIKCTVLRNWMIPKEAVGEVCLLVRIDDQRSKFWIGVIRALPAILTVGENRDKKVSISAEGKKAIRWLVEAADLPTNLLSELPPELLGEIMGLKTGQARINELFRRVQGRIIPRVAIETVARQKDPMKRVRDARKQLEAEGILILGHEAEDREIARARRFPMPKKGEFLAVSV